MSIIESIFGTESDRYTGKLKPTVKKINSFSETFSALPDEALKQKTEEFKKRIKDGATIEELLPEVFAVVREVAHRTTGLRPFDVQLMGGIILSKGSIAEMRTGEGKTLVATLPAYLHALFGEPVHIVTVNDYLARRDAVWMGQIYAFLGLSIGVINSQNESYIYDKGHTEVDEERDTLGTFKIVYDFLRPAERKEVYACDIVYGTNNEYAFDYLRDNIEYDSANIRQRGFGFAVVDEVDSILIDEARNPLIISSDANIPESYYKDFATLAATYKEGEDFTKDEKRRSILLTPAGIQKAEKAFKVDNVYVEGAQRAIHHLEQALKAKALYKKNHHYVVRDNKIIIVDEFTGRLQEGRQWSEGLHQAIEAREKVPIQKETRTFASITFQNYFRMYDLLSGMTGTALSSQEEFYKVYGTQVISVPTNNQVKRIDKPDKIFQTEKSKMDAVVEKIKELHEKGQPVLVGTASIEHNEALSKKLKKAKIPHEVLNAKNHEREGEIIAQAGMKGRVTVATNLAGRGVDIQLGGTPRDEKAYTEIKDVGGLFVLGTERNESRRVDDQLRGRSGRQGDEGETQFFVSLQDSLVKIFGSERVHMIASQLGVPEEQAIESKLISKSIESAQKRIEGHHFDARRFSLQYDTVLNKQRTEVYVRRREILTAEDDTVPTIAKEYISAEEHKKEDMQDIETLKRILLRSIDITWIEHLELMDYARGSANLRSYGQREPLAEYRKEGNRLFSTFWEHVQHKATEEYKHQKTKKAEEENQ